MFKAIIAGLFIAGIIIGIAYFSLPIFTGIIGFIPGTLLILIIGFFALSTSLLYAEATLTQPDGTNLASISRALLGKTWMTILIIVFTIYLLAYLASYAHITTECVQWIFQVLFKISLSQLSAKMIGITPFFLIVMIGVRFSFCVQVFLMIGLAVSFVATLCSGKAAVIPSRLLEQQWEYAIFSVPILLSALGFVGMIPSISTFLNRKPFDIKLAIWIGCGLPVIVYIFWQWLLIGSFSMGNFWILYEKRSDFDEIIALAHTIPNITYSLQFLIFFSMVTSLVGNGVVMVDFVGDLIKIPLEERKGLIRILLSCLVYGLAFLVASYKDEFFIASIQRFTIPIGVILINGIMPLCMVVQARYIFKMKTPRMLGGGSISLFLLGVCLMIIIFLESIDYISSSS